MDICYIWFVFKSIFVFVIVGYRGFICEIDVIIVWFVYLIVVSLDDVLKNNVISLYNELVRKMNWNMESIYF